MIPDDKTLQEIYKKLSADFPDEAIQRTKKDITKKGYDTTGYGYQCEVDRFNEVLGLTQWGYWFELVEKSIGAYSTGKPFVEVTVICHIWLFERSNERPSVGGHTSSNFADAYKGATTNGFKKTAAFWGVGKKAYLGTIDDDNQNMDGHDDDKQKVFFPKDEEFKYFADALKLYYPNDEQRNRYNAYLQKGATQKDIDVFLADLAKNGKRKDEAKIDAASKKLDGVLTESDDVPF